MKTVLFTLALFLLCASLSSAVKCGEVTSGNPEHAIKYLRVQNKLTRAAQDAPCITAAIRQLEHDSSPGAAEVLIQFLDFKRPATEMDRYNPNSDPTRFYPASSTLMTLGEVAIPSLLAAIKGSDSAIVKQNAVHSLMGIRRDDPASAVRLLREESTKTTGAESDALMAAARYGAQSCSPRFKQRCTDQLNKAHAP